MKIKVIDLLNKIANGEEAPQKIKVGNKVYNYETFNIGKGDNYFTAEWEEVKGYRINYDGTYYYLEIRDYNLNDEVEIIEETPKVQVEMTEKEYFKYLDEQHKYMEQVKNYKPKPSYLKIEEEKKIPEKINNGYTKQSIVDMKEARFNSNDMAKICNRIGWLMENRNELSNKIDEIIDYLKSKGE